MSRELRAIVVFAVVVISGAQAAADEALVVDFRYAPTWWQTCIGLPDDWQKTLVGPDGELLYDYPGSIVGANGVPGYRTRIGFALTGDTRTVRQTLASPRLPIVRTVRQGGAIELTAEAFASPPTTSAQSASLVLERLDVENGHLDWALPKVPCDPAFRNVAVCWAGPVRYCVRAAAGEKHKVALGFCEGHWQERGRRVLDVRIEGKVRRTVDSVAEYGWNVPGVVLLDAADEDGDGWVDIAVGPAKTARDETAILNALWVFGASDSVTAEQLVTGRAEAKPLAFVDCGGESGQGRPGRTDVVVLRMRNSGTAEANAAPVMTIESQYRVSLDAGGRKVLIGRGTRVLCSERFDAAPATAGRTEIRWPPVMLKGGEERAIVVRVVRGGTAADESADAADPESMRAAAERYWAEAPLPYGRIEVPDAGVQGVLDAAIRGIYQAREIKHGLPAFQVGPTCYRGLWVVDGSFLMEAVAYLGRLDEARAGVTYLLDFQRDDGAIMLMDGHWKETGIAIWAAVRHATLSGDEAWLRSVWPRIVRGVAYIRSLRRAASADPAAPNAGLVPAGMSDGGLGGMVPEYTNVYWTLVGLKAAVEAAGRLGYGEQARDWQREYDDFFAAFRKAAARDVRTDAHGNRYLPIPMTGADKVLPQRAQWAFLHAVFPGKLFTADDPLVRGNMAMLRATERERLVLGTGWIEHGIWNYFGSFYAHGWLWLGDGQKAAETLYAFANHASPLLAWREEQLPAGASGPEPAFVGDMPHNWASAEFVRLTRHLLVLERSGELHLLEGVPAAWAKARMVTRGREIATEFGPVSLELSVAEDGRSARLWVDPPKRKAPSRLVVHLDGWSGGKGTIDLSTDRPVVREIQIETANR